MNRPICAVLAISMTVLASTGSALELSWRGGGANVSVTSATRCTLQVTASANLLPSVWRLVWVTDSCAIAPVSIACGDAEIATPSISSPLTLSGLVENRLIASFCSADPASEAWYAIDVPAGCRSNLKVVALDPSDPDSTEVLQSSPVTINGGCNHPFPPVILRIHTIHESTDYQLTAIGADLSEATAISLAAPDASWNAGLTLGTTTSTMLQASASLAAVVPACFVRVDAESGYVATCDLPEELTPTLGSQSSGASCQETYREAIPGFIPGEIQPKDFSFVAGGWTPLGTYVFHLFYIRQNQFTKAMFGVDQTEKNIGHAISNDVFLQQWSFVDTARDTMAISVRPGKFDALHVWAPCVVRKGVTYYMFYTGADANGDQRMGLATSTDLFNWTQQDEPIIDYTALGQWAVPKGQNFQGKAQFRDPFVMPDPDNPGDWLMYFITVPQINNATTVVGYKRSYGDLTAWEEDGPIYASLDPTGATIESPLVFSRRGRWWLFTTAAVANPEAYAISNPTSPIDPVTSNWSRDGSINDLIIDESTHQPSNAYTYWKATELLDISATRDVAYFAAFNDHAQGISYFPARTASAPYLFEEHCPVSALDVPAVPAPREVLLSVKEWRADGEVVFSLQSPRASILDFGIYDLSGRRIATLFHGRVSAGNSEYAWPASGARDAGVPSGIFACTRVDGVRKSVAFPVLR